MQRCQGKTKANSPCGMPPIQGGKFCFNHDPGRTAERERARLQGGAARGVQLRRRAAPGDPAPVPAWWSLGSLGDAARGLAHVARETLSGRLDARTANATTGALSVLIGALREAELEARITALEQGLSGEAPRG